jgi:hypothetical protein
MKDIHITELLDQTPLASLSETEVRTIRTHAQDCAGCADAFAAAQISVLLIKEQTSAAAEQALNANPFFETRVLAAWREQQAAGAAWSLRRLWNAAGALVASMAVTTAALVVLTFVAPATDTTTQTTAAVLPSSAESVVLDQGQDEMTNDQVLSAIYYDEDEGK